MNNKKLKFSIISILVLVITCLAIFSGCKKDKDGGDSSSSESSTQVYIEKSLQPRLLYVEGQDLDFSTGAITIANGSDVTRVPLNDSRVTVTGYDKNTIGTQTITVSIDGKSTTLTVGVIARMTVENADTEYFTYENFNKSKGRVKIANDDASTSYVEMSDSSITVTSFNNTVAGSANAIIKYTNGSTSYECSFPVTFYEAAEIDFRKPTKDDYFSHETELNFKGSYLQLKAAKPSTFKKSINITSDMVSGYDPASVTVTNKAAPVTQTITVTYAGREWTFDVNVLYSPVYVIDSLSDKLGNVDSYLEIPEGKTINDIKLPAGAGEAAKEAIIAYFTLLNAGQSDAVDADLILDFARVAAFYININDYVVAIKALNKAFSHDEDGNLVYIGETKQDIQNAIEVLLDPESDYNKHAELMLQIKNAFGEEQLNSAFKISVITSAHTPAEAAELADELQHILDVYAVLENVPANWQTELSDAANFTNTYGADIIDVVFKISSRKAELDQDYNATKHANMYAVIIRWRQDFFEIVYSYYYYAKENGKDQIYTDLWGTVPAPGVLEDFRNAFNTTYNWGVQITNAYQQSIASITGHDLYRYHYFYRKTLDFADQVKNSGNELYTTIYNVLNLDARINAYLNAPSSNLFGYYDFVGPLLGNEKSEAALDAYYALLDVYATTGQIAATNENRAKVIALFDAMTDLSPTEFHWFLSSVVFNYHAYGGTMLIFNENGNWQKFWIGQIMYGFFLQELPQDSNVQTAFINLLKAMEIYATSQYNDLSLKYFEEFMATAIDSVNAITNDSYRSKFMDLVGDAYDKYRAYYTILKTQDGKVDLSDGMKEKFDELYNLLNEFNSICNDSTKMKNAAAYPVLITLYEQAKAVYGEISAAAMTDSTLRKALDAHYYTESQVGLKFTVDSYYHYVQYVIYGSLVANGHLDYTSKIADVLNSILPFLEAELNATVYEDIESVIAIVRALDDEKLSIFYSINAGVAYNNALKRYATDKNYTNDNLNPGAAEEKINEFLALYKEFYEMYAIVKDYVNYTETQRTLACTAMIAIYNRANIVYGEILEIAKTDDGVKNAVNFKLFTVTVKENVAPSTMLLDDFIVDMKFGTTTLLSSSEELINAAKVEKVQALLIKLTALLKAEATGTAYTGNDILELLAELRALTPDEKYAFYVLQGNLALYAELERYLEAKVSADTVSSEIIPALINAEIFYSLYERDNADEDSLKTFRENMEKAIAAFDALDAEDKALLGDLYYNDLLAKYNALPAEEPAA